MYESGIQTKLILGPSNKVDESLDIIRVTTADEMLEAKNNLPADIGIFSVAVSDFRATKKEFKLKKNKSNFNINFYENTILKICQYSQFFET